MLNPKLNDVTTDFGFYYFSHALPDELMQVWKSAGHSGGLGNQEYEFCRKKVFLCNARDLANANNRLSWEYSKLRQPTEREVKRAMIWGDGGDYSIKAGGGAISDCAYTSVLKGLISDHQGLDKEILVIKKYSTDFQDVLITAGEIEALERALMTKPARSKALYDDLCLTIRLLISHYRGQPTMRLPDGKKRVQTKDEILQYWDEIRATYPSFIIKKYFDRDLAVTIDADIMPLMQFIKDRFLLLLKVKNVSEIESELTADFHPLVGAPLTIAAATPVIRSKGAKAPAAVQAASFSSGYQMPLFT